MGRDTSEIEHQNFSDFCESGMMELCLGRGIMKWDPLLESQREDMHGNSVVILKDFPKNNSELCGFCVIFIDPLLNGTTQIN